MILLARLFFPFPLLIAGITGINTPWIVAIAVALAIAPLLFPQKLLGRRRFGQTYFAGALALFATGALIGVLVSYDLRESLPMFFTIAGSISLLFVILNSTVSMRVIAAMLAFLGALVAVYFATQYAYFYYPLENGTIAQFARRLSLNFPELVFFTPHPNAVATFLEGTIFLALGLARIEKTRQRWLWWAIIMLMAYSLFISDSRGAMLSVALTLGLWVSLYFPRVWRSPIGIMGGTALGVVALIFVVAFLTDNALFSPLIARAVHGFGGRYALYSNSIELLRDYPFTGLGLGNAFAMVYSRYQLLIDVPFLYYAHNMPLAVWLGQGVLGLVGFVWLIIQFYRRVWQAEQHAKHIPRRALFRGSWLGVTATLIHGLFDATQFSPDRWTMPLLFALIGLAAISIRRTLRTHSPRQTKYKSQTWAWATAFIVLLLGITFAQKIIAQWQVNAGALYQTYGELSPDEKYIPHAVAMQHARQIFESVLEKQPQNSVANRRLGMMALDDENFALATAYLEDAYRYELHNQPTIKALGYAYLWTGEFDKAAVLFRQVEFQIELVDELHYYNWYWNSRHRDTLAQMAMQMEKILRQ